MQFWLDIAAFALKALILVLSFGALILLVARSTRGGRSGAGDDSEIRIERLDERWRSRETRFRSEILPKKEFKLFAKAMKKAAKAAPLDRRAYVLDFKGDIAASGVGRLGREIDAVLSVARPVKDEVIVRLESPGGAVTGYGLGATQLSRLRAAGIRLTVCVDQVAASGGYLMACVADRIVAAPFAMVGSIGVVAQIPNVSRLLKKNDIDFEELTAGEFKRSVSIFGEITPEGREHFRGKLEATHQAFKDIVQRSRPQLDMQKIANGDVWLGEEALALGMVDELGASDDYLYRLRGQAAVFKVTARRSEPAWRRLFAGSASALRVVKTWLAPLAAMR